MGVKYYLLKYGHPMQDMRKVFQERQGLAYAHL